MEILKSCDRQKPGPFSLTSPTWKQNALGTRLVRVVALKVVKKDGDEFRDFHFKVAFSTGCPSILTCNMTVVSTLDHSFLTSSYVFIHIDKPSGTTNYSQTLIDLILTKIEDNKTIDSGVIELGISDHSLVYICRKISIPKKEPKLTETRQFSHFNSTDFQNNLREAFSNFNHYTDPNLAWHQWKWIFVQIADKHAPLRLRKVKSEYTAWLTNDIKNMSYHRDYLKKKAVSHNSPAYHEAYKKCRNEVNRRIKVAKTNYYKTSLENSTNSKDSWNIINGLLNKKSKTTSINELIINQNKITGDKNIANEFNNFFCKIGPQRAENIPPSDFDPLQYVIPVTNVFEFKNITRAELMSVLKKIKASKAPGLDKISGKLLKAAGDSIIESCTYVFI